jgi:hypothetical protein
MLTVNELRSFLDQWDAKRPMDKAYVALAVGPKDDPEKIIEQIKSMGYFAMIRTTAMGDEIVVNYHT